MKNILTFSVFIWILFTIACSNGKPTPPEKLQDSEIEVYKEALIKIYPYLVLEDSVYRINISKTEALELQIPEKYYERIKQDLEYTNYIIKEEYNKKGKPIELSPPILDSSFIGTE